MSYWSYIIYNDDFTKFNQNTWTDTGIFIEKAHNLSSLIILSFNIYKSNRSVQNLHSILPRQMKHLEISINGLDQIKRILKQSHFTL